jgi:hypothetical protein
VPDRAREDVAADVMEALVRCSGKIVARMIARSPGFQSVRAEALHEGVGAGPQVRSEAHSAADRYVNCMVATAWITIARRDGRQPKASTPTVERAHGSAGVEPDHQVDRAIGAVERALEAIAAARPQLHATYQEMWSLAMEEQTMAACIARELGTDGSPRAVIAARDRLQQRHRRLRVLLVKALEQLEDQHALDHDDARLGRRFVEEVLNRAPKHRRS